MRQYQNLPVKQLIIPSLFGTIWPYWTGQTVLLIPATFLLQYCSTIYCQQCPCKVNLESTRQQGHCTFANRGREEHLVLAVPPFHQQSQPCSWKIRLLGKSSSKNQSFHHQKHWQQGSILDNPRDVWREDCLAQ